MILLVWWMINYDILVVFTNYKMKFYDMSIPMFHWQYIKNSGTHAEIAYSIIYYTDV